MELGITTCLKSVLKSVLKLSLNMCIMLELSGLFRFFSVWRREKIAGLWFAWGNQYLCRHYEVGPGWKLLVYSSSKISGQPSFTTTDLDACAAVIAHRIFLLHLYQQNKLSVSKSKFRQASNHCKNIEVDKFAYANKTWEFNTSKKFGYCNFWRVPNRVPTKCKSVLSPLFNGPKVLSSVSDMEEIFFVKIFSKNVNLDDSGVSLSRSK